MRILSIMNLNDRGKRDAKKAYADLVEIEKLTGSASPELWATLLEVRTRLVAKTRRPKYEFGTRSRDTTIDKYLRKNRFPITSVLLDDRRYRVIFKFQNSFSISLPIHVVKVRQHVRLLTKLLDHQYKCLNRVFL